jgi:ElaA protein
MATDISAPAVHWTLKRFDALTPDEVYDLLRLRCEVFVVEQACPYLDPDDKDRDPQAHHLLGRAGDGRLAAYLRLLPPGLSYAEASFGRVVTAPAWRGRGLGDALVIEALRHLHDLWPHAAIRIGAQAHLVGYYGKHGFVVCSDEYDEDGIPHREMRLEARRGAGTPFPRALP